MLDFSDDVIERLRKLESILFTSGWRNYLMIRPEMANEDKLLFQLLREGAIAVGEIYYEYTQDFSDE